MQGVTLEKNAATIVSATEPTDSGLQQHNERASGPSDSNTTDDSEQERARAAVRRAYEQELRQIEEHLGRSLKVGAEKDSSNHQPAYFIDTTYPLTGDRPMLFPELNNGQPSNDTSSC
ncbi:hypothetical protein CERSUDRAFT_92069 [Gelatoporia subvermispora B]|uniref:Uncharacterized protein n=1 Tax=Ceriporiopsis subvermispora (strain B) TaxID=914234 RepID=M2RL74_CERS8|nr:hypothetical protein CERSUDRAFT_92069 [Gelatoporia subvermispora B]